ncbi:MAG: ASCH domain-containing protein [Ignavibacteria bacterium]
MKPEEYYKEYLMSIGKLAEFSPNDFITDSFGDSPELADKLLEPVLKGIKTATCSALWEYENEKNSMPNVGLITIVLDGKEQPSCIIETTEVTIRKYNAVDEVFAKDEGEGDLSLEYWRDAHKRFFSRTLPDIGREFTEDMLLVCERFKVVWK